VCLAEGENDCGNDCTFTVSDGVLTITGAAYDSHNNEYCHDMPPWFKDRDTITKIVVNGLGSVYDCAFIGLTKVQTAEINLNEDCGSYCKIWRNAFQDCTSLTSVTFNEHVVKIDDNVFSGCTSLTTVTIPASVTDIASNAFSSSSLASVVVADGSEGFAAEEGVLFDHDKEKIIFYPPAKATTEYNFPATVTSFASNAFVNAKLLQKVKFNADFNGWDTYSSSAFNGCSGLKEFVVEGNTNFEVESGVLFNSGKSQLLRYPPARENPNADKSYVIPDGVSTVGSNAFEGCDKIEILTICKDVYSFADDALNGCVGLTKISVNAGNTHFVAGEDVALVESNTLLKYPAKKATLVLPDGVTEFSNNAFEGSVLTTITVPASVSTIRSQAFKNSALTEFTLPITVTSLDKHAFDGCTSIAKFVVAEGTSTHGYTVVDDALVSGKTLLVKYPSAKAGEFVIPQAEEDPINEIETLAFEKCALTSLTIPDSVNTINSQSFVGCAQLNTVTYNGKSKPGYGYSDAFVDCATKRICVPAEYVEPPSYGVATVAFCGVSAVDCAAPGPEPQPTPKSSSAAAVVPTLFAVVAAVLAIFF